MYDKPITITNARGERVEYRFSPWPGSHGLEMLRRLGPLLQGAISTAGAIASKAKSTGAATKIKSWVDSDESSLDDLDVIGTLSEISEKAGGDIASAVGWVVRVLKDEGDADLFMRMLIGNERRTHGKDDGHRFEWNDASLAAFDRAYAGNLLELFAAMTHIIRINFSDFFTLGNAHAPSTAGEQDVGADTLTQGNKQGLVKKRRSLQK